MGRKLSQICTSCRHLFAVSCCLIAASTISVNAKEADWIKSSSAQPVKVIDGDSLEIGTKRIRLIGIDAPEYDQHCKDKNNKLYPCGKQSAQYLQTLVNTATIKCKPHKKDKYKRLLCTCYADNTDINSEMIKNGQAIVYLESPYQKDQAEAKKKHLGIWQGIFMHPRLFRLIKSHLQK